MPEEIEPALKNKLIEETQEVINAKTETNLIEELGDVYEVLLAYLKYKGVSQEKFQEQVDQKRVYKGGFKKFIEMKTD